MTDYKFDVDEVGEETASSVDTDSSFDSLNISSLLLLPLTVIGVYAFIDKALVVAALEGFLGGSLALGIGSAFWVVGAITVGAIGLIAIGSVAALVIGLVTQSGAKVAVGLIGIVYFIVGYVGANALFTELPLLVGFVLTSSLVIWGLFLVIGTLVFVGTLIAI